jgi:hypothetical protein
MCYAVFPYWSVKRAGTELDRLASTMPFRIAVAVVLICIHVSAFKSAAVDRLDLPFNDSVEEAPIYTNIHAPAVRGYPRQPRHWSRLIVSRWDAQIYIGYALRGMQTCPEDSSATDIDYLDCGLAWLPAWGMLGGVVSKTIGVAPDYTLWIMAMLGALVVNLLWTSNTIVRRIGRLEAYAALIAFNFFPSGFYLVTPYAESWTLALVLAGFICLANDRWTLAAFAIGAATGLRTGAVGFAAGLGIAALVAVWRRRKDNVPRWWAPLLPMPLAGWGLAVQLVIFRIYTGDFTAYVRARKAFGDDSDVSRLFDPTFWLRGFSAQHHDMVILFGCVLFVALTARQLLKRLELEEFVFLAVASGLTVMLSLIAVHEYWGINRYLLMAPIAFLGMGISIRKHTVLFVLWLVLSVIFYWHVELCSYLAQGYPSVCPCLGRVEFLFPFKS